MYVASLVLGILSVVFCVIPVLGFILSIVALIISIVASSKLKKAGEKSGIVTAGLVLSIVGISFSTLIHFMYVFKVIYTFMKITSYRYY